MVRAQISQKSNTPSRTNNLLSNMGGGALTGYASDLETRMRIHKGEVGDADTKEALKNLDLANKKLDMPGIISFP